MGTFHVPDQTTDHALDHAIGHPVGLAKGCTSGQARRHAAVALALVAIGGIGPVLSACDQGDGMTVRESECARFCDALEKCEDTTDLLDCRNHCTRNEVRSEAYLRARADCGEMLSCNLWADEVDSQGDDTCDGDCKLTTCVDRALAKVKPSDADARTCMSIATKVNACAMSLDVDDLEDECARTLPMLSVSYVDDSVRCTERSCGEIQSCLSQLAEDYDTDLRIVSADF